MIDLKKATYVNMTSRDDASIRSQCNKLKHLVTRIPKRYDEIKQRVTLKSIESIKPAEKPKTCLGRAARIVVGEATNEGVMYV